jgi:hypothetical protein
MVTRLREELVPWSSQPQELVGVTGWPTPLYISFNPGAGLANLSGGLQPTFANGALFSPAFGEVAARLGTTGVYEHVLFGSGATSQIFSGFLRFYATTTAQFFLFETGLMGGFEIGVSGTKIGINRSNLAVLLDSSNDFVLGWNVVAWSHNGTTGRTRIALNGVLTSGTTTSTFTNFTAYQIGKWSGANGQLQYTSAFGVSLGEVFDDAFLTRVSRSAPEVWSLFAPRTIQVPVSAPVITRTLQRLRQESVPWDSQPQEVVEVDWMNPLAVGLVAFIDRGRNVATSAAYTAGTALPTVGPSGVATLADGAYLQYAFNRSTFTNQCTYFALYDRLSGVGGPNGFVFGDVQGAGAGYNAGLYDNDTKFSLFLKTSGAGTAVSSTTASNGFIGNVAHAGTYDGANLAIYINGRKEATAAKTGNIDAGAFELNINRWNSASPQHDRFYLGFVWNRALSDAEIKSLSNSPWQLFSPRINQIPVYASAGVGTIYYVIGPDAGWVNPTAAEIMAGQLAGGAPATSSGSEVSPSVTAAPFTFSADATGLSASTAYRVAYVWSDE